MERKIVITNDGSQTLYVPGLNEHYHSIHGAITESLHVFVHAGFREVDKDVVNVFEMGFGTGLNACLTCHEAMQNNKRVVYHAVEKYPLGKPEHEKLNYFSRVDPPLQKLFLKMHQAPWEEEVAITPSFRLQKIEADILSFNKTGPGYDMVYFDAFAPDVQPGLWEPHVFIKIYSMMLPGGVLSTYSSKGTVKRALAEAGFDVEKIPGPPGKREMIRAKKPYA